MRPKALLLAALLVPFILGTAPGQLRTWNTADGRSFEAAFVRVAGDQVVFRFENGREFSTPLSSMGPGERALLSSQGAMERQPSPERPGPSNFGMPWPGGVRMDGPSRSKVVSEDAKTGRFIYESPNYRFICDARFTADVLGNFAMMFETTHKYAASLPLSLLGGAGGAKLDILLFENFANYVRAGGPPGTAGCYVPSKNVVMVPMESLGLSRSGTGFSLDTTRHNSVLVHELAHQLTPRAYLTGSGGWFIEGLAEYFAVTPYHWGYFQPDPQGNAALAYATAFGEKGKGGRNLGKTVRAPKLRDFLLMPYGEFAGHQANRNYGLALLVTHYFFHMEGGGRAARITAYLKGLREGKTGEAALAPLLGGGSYEKLEGEIAEAWRRKGVEIRFGG